MPTNLGNYFRQQRIEQGVPLQELARKVGYKNVSKGANRIVAFEKAGMVKDELLINLAEVLGIDLPKIEELMDQDQCR